MSLVELLPKIQELSQGEKQQLMQFLQDDLTTYKTEEVLVESSEEKLLQQLASTEAVVWSPQVDSASVQALFTLVETAKV